ncbi:MAG: Gas vesicle protein GvpA [uncultured Chloroflexi bacterium]|uniref:Gas vesicle protein GvpA n=1 Tax=uncultured Chloroflexota bacterium TaxID=166587 RepID=A0A6J4HMD2_9CHLR|nr:MAG: Gas vesicle protein GvpA [uncultured Chloroflexota bacterium]
MASETAARTDQSGQGVAAAATGSGAGQPIQPAQPVPATPPAASGSAAGDVNTGIYVYNVIEADQPRTFGNIGIGGRGDEVYTVHFRDLAAVVSKTPLVVYDPTRENALAHEHVNELVIEEGITPVPMSFGTVFKSDESVVEFLNDTYDALRDVLRKMKGKLEYGLKVASIDTYLRYAEAMGITAPVARPPAVGGGGARDELGPPPDDFTPEPRTTTRTSSRS